MKKKILAIFLSIILLSGFCLVGSALATGGSTALGEGLNKAGDKAGLTSDTPVESIIGKIIGAVFGFVSLLFLILIIYAGIMLMTAGGEAEQVKKARKTLVHAAIGLFVTLASGQVAYYVLEKVGQATGS